MVRSTFDKHSWLLKGEVYRDDLGVLNMVAYKQYSLHHGILLPTSFEWTRYFDTDGKPQKEVRIFSVETVEISFEQPGNDRRFTAPD